MSDTEMSKGNGSTSGSDWPPQVPQALVGHGRQIQHEAEALATAVRDATDDVQRYLTEQVRQRPLTIVGVAAGVGYALGGGFSARLTALLLGAAARIATTAAARELGVRLLRHGSTSGQKTSA